MSPTFFSPGSPEYDAGTHPHNSVAQQHPAFVAKPTSADAVGEIVREAAARGLTVVPQATGHGSGGDIGDDTVIIDTSALTHLTIDTDARVATAGAGHTWGEVNAAAEREGLLGLAGSSPSVAIAGYTFAGGVGWLSRPHGVAASALRRVEYVDGHGDVRWAADDAREQLDRDALWAYRGGGGVGIATTLEFDLFPVGDRYAGYLLWPIEALDAVIGAWAGAIGAVADDVATSISVLHAPPSPPFPADLRGKPLVHLALSSGSGDAGAAPLLDAVRAAATPAVDTWGPADAEKLGGIHLDPPPGTPALGYARWVGADTPAHVAGILASVAAPDSSVAMLEIRNVSNNAPARPGAASVVVGPYLLHAVGALVRPDARGAVESAFADLRERVSPIDLGLSMGSWVEAAASVPDALPSDVRDRVAAIADLVDPDHRIHRSRFVS